MVYGDHGPLALQRTLTIHVCANAEELQGPKDDAPTVDVNQAPAGVSATTMDRSHWRAIWPRGLPKMQQTVTDRNLGDIWRAAKASITSLSRCDSTAFAQIRMVKGFAHQVQWSTTLMRLVPCPVTAKTFSQASSG